MRHVHHKIGVSVPWTAVALLLLCALSAALFHTGIPVLFPFIQDELGLTRVELGLIPATMAISAAISVAFMGWVVDIWGVRRSMIFSVAGAALCVSLFSQMYALASGILFAVLLGLAEAPNFPAAIRGLMDWLHPRTRSLGIGVQQVGIPIGGALSAAILPSIAVAFGWRTAIIVMGSVIGAIAVLVVLFYRDNPANTAEKPKRRSLVNSIYAVAGNKNILLSSISGGILGGVQLATLSFMILFLKEELQFSIVKAGGFLAISQLSTILGRIGWGAIGDLVLRDRRVLAFAIVGLLSALPLASMAILSPETPQFLVGIVMISLGITVMSWVGPYTIIVAEIAGPGFTGTAIGLSNIIIRIITAIVVPIFGLMADLRDSYDLGWVVVAGLAIVAGLLLHFLSPMPRRI